MIQTNEVLEGVRKLVSTQTSYSKDIRNGSRSLDLNDLRHSVVPPSETATESAHATGQDENGNGNITENGHEGSLPEDGVEVDNTAAVVGEPREEETPSESNPSPGSQELESS